MLLPDLVWAQTGSYIPESLRNTASIIEFFELAAAIAGLVSFIILIFFMIKILVFKNINNKKTTILMYDFIIILIFSILSLMNQVITALLHPCSVCFPGTYGMVIFDGIILFFVVGICFLNHSKNNKELIPKWSILTPYLKTIFAILVVVSVANLTFEVILSLNEVSF